MTHANSSAILHELESFRQMGSALYIAAHPDDENTELLAYLARGRNYRTAYLSLTRGDGGQNVLGSDIGEKLGLARTQELLAARRLDGARQFFSRAKDFGFSKDYKETLSVWDKKEVLSDVVRVIRQFRPDIIITRFAPTAGGTHGHHTASTVLALEAFNLAGNASAYPELSKEGIEPFQPKRIFWNAHRFQHDKLSGKPILKIEAGGYDKASGESFLDIANHSRAMHKTQGFDLHPISGSNGEPRPEQFELLAGDPASKDIMEGIDTTWGRIDGGDDIEKSITTIITEFDREKPAKSVPALLELRARLASLPVKSRKNPIVEEKAKLLDIILQNCLQLHVETTIAQSDVVPGEQLKLHHVASIGAKLPDNISVSLLSVKYPLIDKVVTKIAKLKKDESVAIDCIETLPANTPLTQAYWLRKDSSAGMFQLADEDIKLIGTPENAPAFPIEETFEVGGQTLIVHDEPVQVRSDSAGDKTTRRMDVIPPVSLRFTSEVVLMSPSAAKSVEVEITAARDNLDGKISLKAPQGWQITPEVESFHLAKTGQREHFRFSITAPSKSESAEILANAELSGVNYKNKEDSIVYPHLPPQILLSPAAVKAVSLNLVNHAHKVGYLRGAGDSLPENLHEMGCTVKVLDDKTLTLSDLSGLDAVVIGVRAFNVRVSLQNAMPALFEYVKNGGTVISQYNRPDDLKVSKIAPYDITISASRVTDEKAPVTFLNPDNALLNSPNKITNSDFDGWVQERGLYFPDKWDEHFTPVIACNDSGEAPLKGGLLLSQYGKGYYIYTGLSFFRQLPAGVSGAYRLLANMLSIGK